MTLRRDLNGSLGNSYSNLGTILETFTCRVSKAQEVGTGVVCSLVEPKIAASEPVIRQSITWLEAVCNHAAGLFRPLAYGLDRDSTLYMAVPTIDAERFCKGGLSVQEAERRFVSLLRALKKLHDSGVFVGDLTAGNVLLDRSGSLQLIGSLGPALSRFLCTRDGGSNQLAPELSAHGDVELTSSADVFSLGSIAYALFTGEAPDGQPISSKISAAPIWIDVLSSRCLDHDPSKRYQNAGEVLAAIDELRKKAAESEFVPASVNSAVADPSAGARKISIHSAIGKVEPSPEATASLAQPSSVKKKVLLGGGAFLVLSVGLYGYKSLAGNSGSVISQTVTEAGVQQPKSLSPQEQEFLQKLAAEPKSVTTAGIIKQLQGIPSLSMRVEAENYLVQRVKEENLPLVGVQLELYFAKVRSKAEPEGYGALLRSVDSRGSVDDMATALREAYATDPESALRVAAALALDSGNSTNYRELLAQLVGDRLQLPSTEDFSSVGLLLLPEDLALLFSEAIFAETKTLTDKELPQLLTVLAERKDLSLRTLVSLALERGIVDSIPSVFLEVIRDRRDLSPEILSALVKGAVGKLETGNLDPLGQWFDPDAPRVLMAALATATNPVVVEEAMDLLAGKGVSEEPAATFLEYVRKRYWEKRGSLGFVVGVFAFLDRAPEEVVKAAIERLGQFAADKDLIKQVLMTNNSLVVPRIIKRFPEFIELGLKLDLLANPSKEIRLAAVESIETNDIGALKLITDAYKAEQDPEVKQAYQRFWTISNRMK
jgi:serine/threonine protein kinase